MADQAVQWTNVSDVDTLKSMLAAQQAQLAQLQNQTPVLTPAPATAPKHSERKRKAVKHDEDCSDYEDAELGLDQDDDEYDPANDSDYDEPKKKKKQSTSAKKGPAAAGKGTKKKRRAASDADTDDCSDDEGTAGRSSSSGSAAQVSKAAAAALRSIKSAINAQMNYRPNLKYSNSRVSLELPCLPLAVVTALMGPELTAKASNGKKQLQLKANSEDLRQMFNNGKGYGSCFGKSLRYGAVLGLVDGLTFTYNKGSETLKVHGMYTMFK
ncbi:hypothetical protein OEZ85_006623 [Tetradesmus obliquus]|uniref:Uncharacterized protein n=1 Tax=Tetradesmus obliquus TaxID=3088 RepID=A0ABY8TXB3_TETOB|nr:hypothetical protein OEZ85_006623 [Tetradesmus obliquus]